jgi:hypothetical protein
MARPQGADGGDGFKIWRVDENIFNKKSLIADKRWPLLSPSHKILSNILFSSLSLYVDEIAGDN